MNIFESSLSHFEEDLNSIEKYIECVELQDQILALEAEQIKELGIISDYRERLKTVKNSQVQYSGVIISLYGKFEFFIDDIFKKYIESMVASNRSYNDLPEKMRNKHIIKTGEFLSNPNRYQNYELTQKMAIENLCVCLNNAEDVKVNQELLLSHGGNLKIGQIVSLMTDLGINDPFTKILYSKDFIAFYAKSKDLTEEHAEKTIRERPGNKQETFFYVLERLVKERNKIAHSGMSDNRLAYSTIKEEIIPFLKNISQIIMSINFNEYCNFLFQNGKMHSFDSAIEVFNNEILGINSKDAKLIKGNYIFTKNDKKILCLKIKNLQVNSKDVDEVLEGQDVGIKVDQIIKKNWEFYYYETISDYKNM